MKQNSLALLAPGHYIFATKIELAEKAEIENCFRIRNRTSPLPPAETAAAYHRRYVGKERKQASSIKRRELCKNKYKLGWGRSFGYNYKRYEGATVAIASTLLASVLLLQYDRTTTPHYTLGSQPVCLT
ncbi:hypothetical protein P8452_54448 [Trifolium repens]|nr:hypothetical protein P8452_54448 [Trifolium repens]